VIDSFVQGHLQDVKACAEVGGVSECLELSDRRGIGPAFHFPQPRCGEAREPRALGAEASGNQAMREGCFSEVGEIDVSGDIAFAWIGEGIFSGLML